MERRRTVARPPLPDHSFARYANVSHPRSRLPRSVAPARLSRAYITSSTIGDFDGLFAQCLINPGEAFCTYQGFLCSSEAEASARALTSNYVYQMVDASVPASCYGRYINDSHDPDLYNCKAVRQPNGIYHICATEVIYANQECFLQYLGHWTSSPLTQPSEISSTIESLPSTFIPPRNTILCAIADSDKAFAATTTQSKTSWYFDNAASMSTCNSISDLVDVEEIKPIVIGGMNSGVTVTHKGYVRFLPRAISVCFYSPLMTVNLISLGAICRGGGSYHTCPGELALEIIFNDVVVAKTHLTSNNLLPVPLNLIKTNLYLSLLNETIDPVALNSTPALADVTSANATLDDHTAALEDEPPANTHHINKEELLRAQLAEDLHFYLHHPSDGALCQALNQNSFTGPNVTSTDVATNRRLRGPCPICIEAKLKQKPMPPSTTPPATSICQTLSVDIHKLTTCTPGGYTHELTAVDEKSGRIDVVASKSKKPTDIYAAIWQVLQLYNRSRFVVKHIHVDAE